MGKKLAIKYVGPYEVVGTMTIRDEDGNSIIDYIIKPERGSRNKTVHASKLKKCFSPKIEVVRAPRRRRSNSLPRTEQIEVDQANGDEEVVGNAGLDNDITVSNESDDEGNLLKLSALMDKFNEVKSNYGVNDNTMNQNDNDIVSDIDERDIDLGLDDDELRVENNDDDFIEDDYIEQLIDEEQIGNFWDDIEVELDELSKDLSAKVIVEEAYEPNSYYEKQCEELILKERPKRITRPIERLGIRM